MADTLNGDLNLVNLPDVVLDAIFSNLSYDEIGKNRIVCKRFDSIGKSLLNRGFISTEKYNLKCLSALKDKMPRRESERKVHSLNGQYEILSAIERILMTLRSIFCKYVNSNCCCFFPGKVIDEADKIIRLLGNPNSAPINYGIIKELRDLSGMAKDFFMDEIRPNLKCPPETTIESLQQEILKINKELLLQRTLVKGQEKINIKKESQISKIEMRLKKCEKNIGIQIPSPECAAVPSVGPMESAKAPPVASSIDSAKVPAVIQSKQSAKAPPVASSIDSAKVPLEVQSEQRVKAPPVVPSTETAEVSPMVPSIESAKAPSAASSIDSAKVALEVQAEQSVEAPPVVPSTETDEVSPMVPSIESAKAPPVASSIDSAKVALEIQSEQRVEAPPVVPSTETAEVSPMVPSIESVEAPPVVSLAKSAKTTPVVLLTDIAKTLPATQHAKVPSVIYKCLKCMKVFSSKQSLKRHSLTHLEKQELECDECKQIFTRKDLIIRHIKHVHTGKKLFCKICKKTLKNKDWFHTHMRQHNFPSVNRCTICNQNFSRKFDLRRHMLKCRQNKKCRSSDRS